MLRIIILVRMDKHEGYYGLERLVRMVRKIILVRMGRH